MITLRRLCAVGCGLVQAQTGILRKICRIAPLAEINIENVMVSDMELLHRYADTGDESAFRELVDRYLPLVYSAALRQLGSERHWVDDVIQGVFVQLARQAGQISSDVVVAGWIYRTTRFVTANFLRNERRRRMREIAVARDEDLTAGNTNANADSECQWVVLERHLDEALMRLGQKDRSVILLRFFQHLDFQAIGTALDVSDDTAQKRVSRALDKLRGLLMER